jgi:hypothetical protein
MSGVEWLEFAPEELKLLGEWKKWVVHPSVLPAVNQLILAVFNGEFKNIFAQLESCGFECEGGPLENNVAYRRLKSLLDF